MGVVVAFDYATWIALYPEFSGINQSAATSYFNQSAIYCRNDGGGPICDAALQSTLLNMLTAHIAALNSPRIGESANSAGSQPASPLVGRIGSASEGSVSVTADMPAQPGTAAWFQQTQYGASYYQATAPFRTMRYASGWYGGGVFVGRRL